MIHRPTIVGIAVVVGALTLSGCYTLLQVPRYHRRAADTTDRTYSWEDEAASPQTGDVDDAYSRYPYGYGPSRATGSVPVFGYDALYGLYGYGSPYAYGPYGGRYGGGYGYASAAGPYGYGYDPYYSGYSGQYAPPGYELITTDALDALRSAQRVDSGVDNGSLSAAERATQVRRQQDAAQRAWTQRTQPHRKSTTAVRTTRPVTSRSRVTTSSGSSTSTSSAPKSGSAAAKRRKQRR